MKKFTTDICLMLCAMIGSCAYANAIEQAEPSTDSHSTFTTNGLVLYRNVGNHAEEVGYQVEILPFPASTGSVITNTTPTLEGYYTKGEEASWTFVPADGIEFMRWRGDVPADQTTKRTIHLKMDSAKSIAPYCRLALMCDNTQTSTDEPKFLSEIWQRIGRFSTNAWLRIKGYGLYAVMGLILLSIVALFVLIFRRKPEWSSSVVDGSASISGCGRIGRKLAIPAKINGCTVKSIGKEAFADCTDIKTIAFPPELSSIGPGAFSGCVGLQSVIIPSGVATIEADTFADCRSMKDAVVSDGVKTIGSHAFAGCTVLKSISIPRSVTNIEHHAFVGCGNLKRIRVASSDANRIRDLLAKSDFNVSSLIIK